MGLSPALTTQLELFTDRPQTNSSVMPVNRQLFYLPPVGIFILLCRQFFVLQFSGMSVNHLGVAKYIGLYKQQQFNILPIVSSMQRFFLLHHRIKFTAKCTVFIYRPFNPSSQPSDFVLCLQVIQLFIQVNVYKQPITDSSKNSKKGLLSLELNDKGEYVTVEEGRGQAEKVQFDTIS